MMWCVEMKNSWNRADRLVVYRAPSVFFSKKHNPGRLYYFQCAYVCVYMWDICCCILHIKCIFYSPDWREFPLWITSMKIESSTYNFPHLMIVSFFFFFFHQLVSGSLLVKSCFSTPHIILMLGSAGLTYVETWTLALHFHGMISGMSE